MENSLPKGWVECKLGEVCSKPQYGWTSKANKSGRIKYLRTTDISNRDLDWNNVPYCEEEPKEIEKYQVFRDDILVSRAGSVGFSFRIKEEINFKAVFASYLIRFKAYDEITARLVDYYLQSEDYWKQISDFTAGIAIPNVNASKLEELLLALPPLAEQHRIVAKLDELLTRVANCKSRLEKIPALLKNFRQSVLAAAVSGELTNEWREENSGVKSIFDTIDEVKKFRKQHFKDNKKVQKLENFLPDAIKDDELPESWAKMSFSNISSIKQYAMSSGPFGSALGTKDYVSDGIPVIRGQNIQFEGFINKGFVYITEAKAKELERSTASPNDIAIVAVGAGVGNSAIVPSELPKAVLSQNCNKFTLDLTIVDPKYVLYNLKVSVLKDQMNNLTTDTARQFLSLTNLKGLLFAIPPPEEQKEIVRKVEELFHFADSVEARYQKAKAWFDKLPQAILAKAFRGELVEQDANDEPASVLMERIKKEKQNTNKPKPTAKRKKIYEENEGVSLAADE